VRVETGSQGNPLPECLQAVSLLWRVGAGWRDKTALPLKTPISARKMRSKTA